MGYYSSGGVKAAHKAFQITNEPRQQSNGASRLFHDMQLAHVALSDKITDSMFGSML